MLRQTISPIALQRSDSGLPRKPAVGFPPTWSTSSPSDHERHHRQRSTGPDGLERWVRDNGLELPVISGASSSPAKPFLLTVI